MNDNQKEKAIIWFEKGNKFLYSNHFEDAISSYDLAIEYDSENASIWNNKGKSLIALNKHEDALQCFIIALDLDPQIPIPVSYKELCERELAKNSEEERRHWRERTKKQQHQEEMIRRQQREEIERQKQIESSKHEEERKRLVFKDNLSQLVREIELCADEKPCPNCNELEVMILSLSPNARSVLARCKHCRHEYRIKLEPDEPQKIINLFNSFLEGGDIYLADTKNALPVWRMEIKKRQVTNQREPIPSAVKKAVWKRDGGKCANCGSEVELEYDHIIPVVKGGSSTIQNIQILCKKCNRKKHASIE